MVVVVLPSPSGVGVIAVTSIYFPLGRFLNRSKISNFTLALYGPYSSSSFSRMPYSFAICKIGFNFAACATLISDGTGRNNFIFVGLKEKLDFAVPFFKTFFTTFLALAFTLFFADFFAFVTMPSP